MGALGSPAGFLLFAGYCGVLALRRYERSGLNVDLVLACSIVIAAVVPGIVDPDPAIAWLPWTSCNSKPLSRSSWGNSLGLLGCSRASGMACR